MVLSGLDRCDRAKLEKDVLSWLPGGSPLQQGLLMLEGGLDDDSVLGCVAPSSSRGLQRSCEGPAPPSSCLSFPSLLNIAAGDDLVSASSSTLTWTSSGLL